MSADTLDFQRLVDARGHSLRLMSFEELTSFVQDSETANINGRKGVISVDFN